MQLPFAPSNIFQHLPTSTSNLQIFLTLRRFAGLQVLVWLQLWLLDLLLQHVALCGVCQVCRVSFWVTRVTWKSSEKFGGGNSIALGLTKLINEISTAEPIWAYSIWAWSDLHNFHMEHFASFLPLKYESNHCSIMFNRLCTNQVWQNPTLSNLCHWSTSTLDVKPRKAKRQMDIDDKAVQREKHTCRVPNFAKLWCRN